VAACEEAKSAQNAIFESEYSKCQNQLTLEKLACETNKVLMKAACEEGRRGPFSCDAIDTVRGLRSVPQTYVDRTQQRAEWLGSPEKTLGEGWIDTACEAKGTGIPYYDAVLSSDGFWTIEVKLESFRIGDVEKPGGPRFVRLVIRPRKWGGGKAHDFASARYITRMDRIAFGGPVVIDRSAPPSLEVHPVDDLEVVGGASSTIRR
jgi:hypothetical protein